MYPIKWKARCDGFSDPNAARFTFLRNQTSFRYSNARCATTPAWSEGHNPEGNRSKEVSPMV